MQNRSYIVGFLLFVFVSILVYSYCLRWNGWNPLLDEMVHLQDGVRIASGEWTGPPPAYFTGKTFEEPARMRGVFSYVDWGRYAPTYFISHAFFYTLLGSDAVWWYRLQFLLFLLVYLLAFHLARRLNVALLTALCAFLFTFVSSAASEAITRMEKPEGRLIPYLFLSTFCYLVALRADRIRYRIALVSASGIFAFLGAGCKEIGVVALSLIWLSETGIVLTRWKVLHQRPRLLSLSYLGILGTCGATLAVSFYWAQMHFLGQFGIRSLGATGRADRIAIQVAALEKYYHTSPDGLVYLGLFFIVAIAAVFSFWRRRGCRKELLPALHAGILIGLPSAAIAVFYLFVYPDAQSYYLSYCVVGCGLSVPFLSASVDRRVLLAVLPLAAICCAAYGYPYAWFNSAARGLQNYTFSASVKALHKWVVAVAPAKRPVVSIPEFLNIELYDLFWRIHFPNEVPPLFTSRSGGEVVFEKGQYKAVDPADLSLQISWPVNVRGSRPFDIGVVGSLYSSLLITPEYSNSPATLLESCRREAEGRVRPSPLSASSPVNCEYSYSISRGDRRGPLRAVPMDVTKFRECSGHSWSKGDAVFVQIMETGGASGAFEHFASRSELEEWYRTARTPEVLLCARGRGRVPGRGQLVIVLNDNQVFRSNAVGGGAALETLSVGVVLPEDPSSLRRLRLSFESVGHDPDLAEFRDWALFVR